MTVLLGTNITLYLCSPGECFPNQGLQVRCGGSVNNALILIGRVVSRCGVALHAGRIRGVHDVLRP